MSADGYFEAFVNARAYVRTEHDRRLMEQVSRVIREQVPGSQVRWAGSTSRSTAIQGSDLDMCVESTKPINHAQRRELRGALQAAAARPAVVQSHVVRLPAHQQQPKLDIAFANAEFGGRPLPDASLFEKRKERQLAARGLKLWLRAPNLPSVPGWALEALVVHGDAPAGTHLPLALFLRIVDWLSRAKPADVESVLRPAAHPEWNARWSAPLPGRLQAISNHARALGKRSPSPASWKSADDVGVWLGQ